MQFSLRLFAPHIALLVKGRGGPLKDDEVSAAAAVFVQQFLGSSREGATMRGVVTK
jgi:hypothetical protein